MSTPTTRRPAQWATLPDGDYVIKLGRMFTQIKASDTLNTSDGQKLTKKLLTNSLTNLF